jgi:hypothetical protein
MTRWRGELQDAGWSPSRLRDALDANRIGQPPGPLDDRELEELVRQAVDADGELARLKVFSRTQVIVAVAPALFGRPVDQLDRVVDRVLADSEVLPMIGVPNARDRHYTLASVVATERAVATLVADGVTRTLGRVLTLPQAVAAVDRAEVRLSAELTHAQHLTIAGLCGQGRQVSLVLGVAGAGKTTALAVVADAYQTAGFRVLGTATAGQAARTLGRQAQLSDSRTMASLRWQLDHDRLTLDPRTLLIVDEAGIAIAQNGRRCQSGWSCTTAPVRRP